MFNIRSFARRTSNWVEYGTSFEYIRFLSGIENHSIRGVSPLRPYEPGWAAGSLQHRREHLLLPDRSSRTTKATQLTNMEYELSLPSKGFHSLKHMRHEYWLQYHLREWLSSERSLF